MALDRGTLGTLTPETPHSQAWQRLSVSREEEDALWCAWTSFLQDRSVPARIYSLPSLFAPYDEQHRLRIEEHNLAVLAAFREAVPKGERLQVLDYHHDWYWFDPHQPIEKDRPRDEIWGMRMYVDKSQYAPMWKVPVLPEGDDVGFYYPAGRLAYGYDFNADTRSVATIFARGEALLAALAKNPSPLLREGDG